MSDRPHNPDLDGLVEALARMVLDKVYADLEEFTPKRWPAGTIPRGKLPPASQPQSTAAIAQDLDELSELVADHIADTDNPHEVTAAQVGAATPSDVATAIAAVTPASLDMPRAIAVGYSPAPAVGTDTGANPTIDDNVTLLAFIGRAKTAPSGGSAVLDVKYFRSGSWTSIFSSNATWTAGSTLATYTIGVTDLDEDDFLREDWISTNGIAGVTMQFKAKAR